jgi:hypothetical protein
VCSPPGTKFLDDSDTTQSVPQSVRVAPITHGTFNLMASYRLRRTFGRTSTSTGRTIRSTTSRSPLRRLLFVNLTTGGPKETLLESLTDGAESITVFDRFKHGRTPSGACAWSIEVKANWKIVCRELQRVPALPAGPPELVQVIPLFRLVRCGDEEIPDDGNRMVAGATSFTRTGESALPKFPDLEPRTTRCTTAAISSRT